MKLFSAIVLIGMLAVGCGQSTAQGVQTGKQQESASSAAKTNSKQEAKSGETTATEVAKQKGKEMNLETATFAGGCFWCTEAVFLALEGVDSVLPGYMGGHVLNPTYKQVCGGATGHAEVIQIKYDPEKISFDELLYIFFKTHDPTTLNRQGNDVGTQYRSAVFYHNDNQKASAEAIKKKIDEAKLYRNPVVTEISEASTMYVAEDYHVNYFNKNPNDGYCNAFIPGKIEKLKKLFGDKLKSQFKN
jgi:peptide-methionine (S)-S-oxide reductase